MNYLALARSVPRIVVGDVSDTSTDYEYGEKQVLELNQYFNAIGRPLEFEAAVEAVWAAYERVKGSGFETSSWGLGKVGEWNLATAMKQVGADASVLMDKIQAAQAHRGASGTAAGTSPAASPSGVSSPVYKPGTYDGGKGALASWESFLEYLPWIAGGLGVLVLGAILAPTITSSIASVRSLRRAGSAA